MKDVILRGMRDQILGGNVALCTCKAYYYDPKCVYGTSKERELVPTLSKYREQFHPNEEAIREDIEANLR